MTQDMRKRAFSAFCQHRDYDDDPSSPIADAWHEAWRAATLAAARKAAQLCEKQLPRFSDDGYAHLAVIECHDAICDEFGITGDAEGEKTP